jgi:hypothetical protein
VAARELDAPDGNSAGALAEERGAGGGAVVREEADGIDVVREALGVAGARATLAESLAVVALEMVAAEAAGTLVFTKRCSLAS